MHQSEIDKEIMLQFYDSIYTLNIVANDINSFSLKNEVEKQESSICNFMKYKVDNSSPYKDYFTKIQNDFRAKGLMSNFIENNAKDDFDDETYETNIDNVSISPEIYYNANTGNYEFAFVFGFKKTSPEILSIKFNNTSINSTKIKSYNLNDFTVVARIYTNTWDETMNSTFDLLNECFKEHEITVTFNNNEYYFKLEENDINEIRAYFLDFILLQNIAN